MPQRLNRAACRARLVELLEAALRPHGAEVHNAFPGETQVEHVYVGPVDGEVRHEDFAGDHVFREDICDLDIVVSTSWGHESAGHAETRAQTLMDIVDEVVVDNVWLDVPGVLHMLVTDTDGPRSMPGGDGGWMGVAAVTVQIHSYLGP